jgi:hypothetical protein
MPSSSLRLRAAAAATLAASLVFALPARAQKTPQGFAVERFYPSAAGGGWMVMDALDMHGGLGGAMALTSVYASSPLRVSGQAGTVDVVSSSAIVDFGVAVTYERFRLYLDLDMPLAITGDSGTLGGYAFTAPGVGLGSTPDVLADPRVGFDARILGGPRSPFRLGVGAQLIVPMDVRADYDTDGTYRAMLRALFAGETGRLTYAGQLGVHVRPLDDSPAPGSPHGSELLFGFAAGEVFPLAGGRSLVLGPEVFGETALSSFFGGSTTGVEALMTARVEGTREDGPQLRVKIGTGGGLDPQFGAPEWRAVLGFEVFGRNVLR